MNLFEFHQGNRPLMISCPHSGCWIPADISQRMTIVGQSSRDTDWFLPRLYDFENIQGASWICSNVSRYVVDLNRPDSNESLYPGQRTTGVCPTITFADQPVYLENEEPSESECQARIETFWRPYHQQLAAELNRLVEQFGQVVLIDTHSIASRVPMLFDGPIEDFNFGTNHGVTCQPQMQKAIENFADLLDGYCHVCNGRFLGGYITRFYGQSENVNASQVELSQATYMNESDLSWNDDKAAAVAPVLQSYVEMMLNWIENP